MSVIDDPSINYDAVVANVSKYKMYRVNPLGGTSATQNATAGVDTYYTIPPNSINLGRLSVNLEAVIPATTGQFTAFHTRPGVFFSRMRLQAADGTVIHDVQNTNVLAQVVTPLVTKLPDFLGRDGMRAGADIAAVTALNTGRSIWQKSRATLAEGDAVVDTETQGVNGTRVAAGVVSPSYNPYDEPQYITASGDNASLAFKCTVDLKDCFPHTLLSYDKSIYWGQNLILILTLAPSAQCGWTYDDTTDWATGYAALAKDVPFTNMYLNVPVEQNEQIDARLKQAVIAQGGLEITYPTVSSIQQYTSAATNSSISVPLSASFGRRLLCVYHTKHHGTSSGKFMYDNSNLTQSKIVSYRTQLDGIPLQNQELICAANDDYDLMKPLFHNSVIQSRNEFIYNQVHIESWRSGKCSDWLERDAEIQGLPLDLNHDYQLAATTVSAAYNNYTFVVTQRDMRITPLGVSVF